MWGLNLTALLITAYFAVSVIQAENVSLMHRIIGAKWEHFKAKHGKAYKHAEEEAQRLNAFLEHSILINHHNERFHRGLETFHLEHNHMSDMSYEEFMSTRLGYRSDSAVTTELAVNETMFSVSGMAPPAEIDWRRQGAVTSVRDQGQCGSCWAFSSVGALEAAFFRHSGKMVSLSEQNLIDCSKSFGTNGCFGGFMVNAFKYVIQNKGIQNRQSYPYIMWEQPCRYNSKESAGSITSFARVPTKNEAALMEALAAHGPISIAIDAGTRTLMMYKGGIFQDPSCSSDKLNHAVLLVGYGSEHGEDFWIVKNSWGDQWGERGYIRIARKNNMCGVTTDPSYPIV